ncbi:MAG: minichromosome maintenance protein MCM [Promethearchaeota archaeon]
MEAINRFKEFFQEFTDENGERIYMKKIQLMISEGQRSLKVNFKNILHFDPELARQLRETNSSRTLRAAERALVDLVHLEDPEYSDKLHVRPYNIHGEQKHTLRSLRAEHLGTVISIDAIVTGATRVKPLLTLGMFKCRNCDTNMRRMQIDGKYNPPYLCENPECGRKGPFQLIQEHSEFIDWQKLIIQEKPEDLLPGQLPVSFTTILQDDIVDTIRPGDRVVIVGILQARPESQLKTGTTATYFEYIDILHAERETGEFEKIQITEEDVETIIELSKDPFIANKIVQSIAPSIWGNDSVKEAIALLLFGGTPKDGIEGIRMRSESNVFLIGDPGTAKSQLLKYVSTIAPRGLFTSGRGSSAAGLTAAVMRDTESGEMALEAGALVLADRGIACIDEFDKMRSDDRDAIHEAMEQHTVSIAKAGIVATLNSRTSILAAANPKYGRWDPMKDPRTQLNMPPTILSRFDLIFVMADEPNPEADEKLSSHILGLHRDATLDKEPPIPRELLTKYIAYARQKCKPVLSDEALEIIKQFYLSLRSKSVPTTGGAEGRRRIVNPIAITARQLESLVRLAEARSKMSLSNTVTARDANAAVKLMEVTMKQIAMDEETGTFDADRWIGGVSTKTRSRTELIDDLIDLVEKNLPDDQKGRGVAIDDIISVGKDQDIDEDTLNAAIEQLLRDGLLFKPREGYVKRI